MALLKCPDCGHNASDQAETCPGCGCPVSKIKEAVAEQEAAMQAPKICQQCGHEIHTGIGICGHCRAFPEMAHGHTPQQKRIIRVGKPWKEKLKALWRGEIPLVKAYWLYGVASIAILGLFSFCIDLACDLPLIDDLTLLPLVIMIIALPLFSFASYLYMVAVWVGVWRSSNRYTGNKTWAGLAKLAVILSAIRTLKDLLGILGMFFI